MSMATLVKIVAFRRKRSNHHDLKAKQDRLSEAERLDKEAFDKLRECRRRVDPRLRNDGGLLGMAEERD